MPSGIQHYNLLICYRFFENFIPVQNAIHYIYVKIEKFSYIIVIQLCGISAINPVWSLNGVAHLTVLGQI
jgi:hypothetical protein